MPKIGEHIYPKDEVKPENPFDAVTEESPAVVDAEKVSPPPSIAESEFSFPFSVEDLELADASMNRIPDPPKCIQDWCKARDLVWRWLSPQMVRHHGMRGYITLSPDSSLRKKIKESSTLAIRIDVENKICWREDAWLGVTPRKLNEYRKATVRQRTVDQTKRARQMPDQLVNLAQRAGVKVKVDINEREAPLRDAFKDE